MNTSPRDPGTLLPLPLTRAWLERFRLASRRRLRASMVGSQLNQRQGQSREFLEYMPYVPGDDARTIDWRASFRYKTEQDYLVRRYMAEEHYKLAISVDTRDTMLLPAEVPKLQLALWIAEAIAWMALRGGHQVALHRLFGPRAGGLFHFRGSQASYRLPAALRRLYQAPITEERANLDDLGQILPPAAIWLILTDMYFGTPGGDGGHFLGEDAQRLARRIASAQSGWRWIILVDIDAWRYEIEQMLGERALELEGFGLPPGRFRYEVTPQSWQARAAVIADFKQRFFDLAHLRPGSIVHWVYPLSEGTQGEYWQTLLRDQLQRQEILKRLFMEAV